MQFIIHTPTTKKRSDKKTCDINCRRNAPVDNVVIFISNITGGISQGFAYIFSTYFRYSAKSEAWNISRPGIRATGDVLS